MKDLKVTLRAAKISPGSLRLKAQRDALDELAAAVRIWLAELELPEYLPSEAPPGKGRVERRRHFLGDSWDQGEDPLDSALRILEEGGNP